MWAVQFAPPSSGIHQLLTLGVQNVVSKLLFAHWVALRLLEEGFITETLSHDETVLRIEPALTIDQTELDQFFDALKRILDENESSTTFARGAGVRLFERRFGRTAAP